MTHLNSKRIVWAIRYWLYRGTPASAVQLSSYSVVYPKLDAVVKPMLPVIWSPPHCEGLPPEILLWRRAGCCNGSVRAAIAGPEKSSIDPGGLAGNCSASVSTTAQRMQSHLSLTKCFARQG